MDRGVSIVMFPNGANHGPHENRRDLRQYRNDERDGTCEFGTGYLIGNGLVVTSAHVLTNAHTKIEVKFRNSSANSGLIDAHLAWDGRPSLDVALLRCQVPNDLPATVQALNTDPPGSGQEAHGKGFPQLTSRIAAMRSERGN